MLHIEVKVKIYFKQEKRRNSKREKIPPPTNIREVTCYPTLLNGFTRYKRNYFYTKWKFSDAHIFEQLTHIITFSKLAACRCKTLYVQYWYTKLTRWLILAFLKHMS